MKMTQPDSNGGRAGLVSGRTPFIEDDTSLAAKLADEAADTVANLVETHYTHNIFIDDTDSIYDCDCSGYVEHLLARIALRHLSMIRDSTGHTRPLAADFHNFFTKLPKMESNVTNGWLQIATLAETNRGDILTWSLNDSSTGDTGHVVIVADTPTQIDDESFAVKVYDSSSIQHFEDSRGKGSDFKGGVGASSIHIDVGAGGTPAGFQFHERALHYKAPIAIARILRFSGG
jgi:hypothetical protein